MKKIMKLKNALLTGLSFVLVAAVAIGATLAYHTSTDSDVNVMTLGNVEIVQHELERVDINEHNQTNAVEFKNFTQGKPLYPAVLDMDGYAANDPAAWAPGGAAGALEDHYVNYGDFVTADVATGASAWNGVWGTSLKNVMDKFVFVENTGESDAYYRTIILLEYDETQTKNSNNQPMIHFNYNGNALFTWEGIEDLTTVEVNGEVYKVLVATYKNPLKPGTVSRPSLLQVGLDGEATNEIVAQFGDTYDILVLSQAVQTEGFANAQTALNEGFGEVNEENVTKWFGGVAMPALVYDAEELQNAINEAKNGDTIILGADIEGDVTVTQEPNVKFTIDGNGKTIDGAITVDGKSKRYETAGVTIQNVKFASDNAVPAAYINLGVSGDTNTRYTNNVTVSNCTFNYSGEGDKAAIKSYTGGDYNLTAEGCTVNAGMHSFMQVTNIEKGLTITDCKVYSKNGINLNNTTYLNMSDCEFDTKGYSVRFGVNGNTTNGNFTIANSTLKSANDDGDAVIIFRGTMTGSTLNLKGTTLIGTSDITGSANIVK